MTVEAVHKQMQEMREDFSKLSSDVKGVLQALLEVGQTEAEEVGDKLRSQVHRQMKNVKHAVKTTRRCGEDAVQMVEESVDRHPVSTILGAVVGALGVGFLLGIILGRRGSH